MYEGTPLGLRCSYRKINFNELNATGNEIIIFKLYISILNLHLCICDALGSDEVNTDNGLVMPYN